MINSRNLFRILIVLIPCILLSLLVQNMLVSRDQFVMNSPSRSIASSDNATADPTQHVDSIVMHEDTHNHDSQDYVYCTTTNGTLSILSLVQTSSPGKFPAWFSLLTQQNEVYHAQMVVVFYKQPSENDQSTLRDRNIHFNIATGTTWGAGRNKLYEEGLFYERNISRCNHHYWMFLDEDVTPSDALSLDATLALFQSYVLFLKEWEPAISFTLYNHCCNQSTLSYLADLNICAVGYGDPLQYVMHREVMNNPIIWPLRTQYDHSSWYHSGYYFYHLGAALLKNHIIQFMNFSIRNPGHHSYPTGLGKNQLQEMRQEMMAEMGPKYDACWEDTSPIEIGHHGPCSFGVPTKKGKLRYDKMNWQSIQSFVDPERRCSQWID